MADRLRAWGERDLEGEESRVRRLPDSSTIDRHLREIRRLRILHRRLRDIGGNNPAYSCFDFCLVFPLAKESCS